MVTLNPTEPWKPALRMLRQAKQLGLEVVVAVDSRTTEEGKSAVRAVADRYIDFQNTTAWPEGALNRLLDEARGSWAFILSDDEEPSAGLWDFVLKDPPVISRDRTHYIWRCRMLAPLPDWSAHYAVLDTYQPRYFEREAIRWPGGFDEQPVSRAKEIDFDFVLWHYTLWSPRAHRQAKIVLHENAWNANWKSHPWPFPGRASYLYEDHPEKYASLTEWEGQRPQ